MLTERQEKLLDFVVREYLGQARPVSSLDLKKVADLDVCGATIRNDLQILTKEGYIEQPHTSAGRVPTRKGYHYIAQLIEDERQKALHNFIVRQMEEARAQMAQEMLQMQHLISALEQDDIFEILNILDTWHKRII